jgi:hypothetical protein
LKKLEKITKITAKGFNSAAYTRDHRLYVWGGTSGGKLSLPNVLDDEPAPIELELEVKFDSNLRRNIADSFTDPNKTNRNPTATSI